MNKRVRIRMATVALSLLLACVGGYLLSPRWQAVRQEQQRLADPLRDFGRPPSTEARLQALQAQIRATPQASELWAQLGEYYLWGNQYDSALLAYQRALSLRGENAELHAALATVLYYRAGQHLTPEVKVEIDRALAQDPEEITALMLLASDAFMQADYARAIGLWQQVLDLNSGRINRAAVIASINMAKRLQR